MGLGVERHPDGGLQAGQPPLIPAPPNLPPQCALLFSYQVPQALCSGDLQDPSMAWSHGLWTVPQPPGALPTVGLATDTLLLPGAPVSPDHPASSLL